MEIYQSNNMRLMVITKCKGNADILQDRRINVSEQFS